MGFRRYSLKFQEMQRKQMPNKQFNKTHLKTLVQFWKQFLTILILLLFPYNMWILLPLQFCAAKTSTSHPHSPKRAPNTQYWPLRKASFTPFLAIGADRVTLKYDQRIPTSKMGISDPLWAEGSIGFQRSSLF